MIKNFTIEATHYNKLRNIYSKVLPKIREIKNFKLKQPLLDPHPNVSLVGHKKGLLSQNEESYHYWNGDQYYFHEGRKEISMGPFEMRKFLKRNLFAAKKLASKTADYNTVRSDWKTYRHIIEEAGSINPSLRFQLLKVDYYDTFRELTPSMKAAVRTLLEGDRSYFAEKIPELEESILEPSLIRQQRLWPEDYARLSKKSYEVVEYELSLRGYVLPLMIEELNQNRDKPLSKQEATLAVLQSLTFTDVDIANMHLVEFEVDTSHLLKYDNLFNTEKLEKQFYDMKAEAEQKLPLIAAAKSKAEAEKIMNEIYAKLYYLIKPFYLRLVKREDSGRLPHRELLVFYAMKYGVSDLKYRKNDDPLGLHKFFLSGKHKYPFFKLMFVTYLIVFVVSGSILKKRVNEFEKKHNVLIGHRSGYYDSTEERFKGDRH